MFLCRANDAAVSETSFMTSGADEGQAQLIGEAMKTQLSYLSFLAGIIDAAQAGQVEQGWLCDVSP